MKLSTKKRTTTFIIIGILFFLSLNFFQKEVKGFFYSVSSPVQKNLWKKGINASNLFEAIFEAKNLEEENKSLELRIQGLLSKQIFLEELEKENKMLREALGLGLQKEFRLELAEIIGKDADKDVILIDKGLKDGITKGLSVITPQKVFIGSIIETYDNYSKVLLISDKESSLEAEIAGSNISGLLKGSGHLKIFLDLIPKEEEVKEGDLVVSEGFLIGLVKEVKKIDVSPFQQAEISPFFDISNTDKVFIILNF